MQAMMNCGHTEVKGNTYNYKSCTAATGVVVKTIRMDVDTLAKVVEAVPDLKLGFELGDVSRKMRYRFHCR